MKGQHESVATPERAGLILLLLALFLSGTAGVANQVLWQRALKIFLGGSETLSSLIVVLVFMFGLGLGAGLTGAWVSRVRHPARLLAWVEICLFATNATLAWIFHLDLRESVYSFERFALALGLPLRAVYALGSLLVLLLPTLLMGATLPIASESCQRQLGAKQSSLLAVLFGLNTLGAVIGACGSSFFLLPVHGQIASLLVAALLNLAAAGLLFVLASRVGQVAPAATTAPRSSWLRALRWEEALGAGLGFLALGYEIYLFRLVALAHQPLPYTFATTLCLYLLFWSIGMFAAAHLGDHLGLALAAGFLSVACMPTVYAMDRWQSHFSLLGLGLFYFVPCLAFGFLYGKLVARSAQHWGHDVGRFSALNTLGACLGVLFFTLIGYEMNHDWNALFIGAGLAVLLLFVLTREAAPVVPRSWLWTAQTIALLGMAGLVALGVTTPFTTREGTLTFWGRDGVVEIERTKDVRLDGLWHTRLSDGKNHIGDRYTWMMAFAAIFGHQDQPMTDALVVGNGVGITASTLAKLDGLSVDAYEINQTLRRVLETFPEETLRVAENPRVHIEWHDARTAMALNPKQYDLIVSAPLHLKQAGCSLLLSREYMTLVKSRLKPGGVFVFYSQEGIPEQWRLIQSTVRSVFPYRLNLLEGLITVASEAPVAITAESIATRLDRADPFYQEAAALNRLLQAHGEPLHLTVDPVENLPESKYVITDDHPLVEYPAVLTRLLNAEMLTAR